MQVTPLLDAFGLVLGFSGGSLVWWVGRKEGGSLPFISDAEGKLLAEIKAANVHRQRLKDRGMLLIAVSFLLQFFALLFK